MGISADRLSILIRQRKSRRVSERRLSRGSFANDRGLSRSWELGTSVPRPPDSPGVT